MSRPIRSRALIAASLALLAACNGGSAQEQSPPTDGEAGPSARLGLFSTLPIYWGEGGDIGSVLQGNEEHGWVRGALEEEGDLVPLDTLEEDSLDGLKRVVLAQPRPLAPSENVAFDTWLREGGQALIFADPMLTQHSDFPLGDPRRPHDMVVISPILNHWGLDLLFDEEQAAGVRTITEDRIELPVDLAGRFEARGVAADAKCSVSSGGLVADCRVGEGRVLLVADAAVLDDHVEEPARHTALGAFLDRAFAD